MIKVLCTTLLMLVLAQEKTQAQFNASNFADRYMVTGQDSLKKLLHNKETRVVITSREQLEPYLKPAYKKKDIPFDFSKHYITGEYVCAQCLAYCGHQQGEQDCHRNRCLEHFNWQVRERGQRVKMDFTLLPFFKLKKTGPDTLVITKGNATQVLRSHEPPYIFMYRTLGGDCDVRFEHAVHIDDEKKTITWTVYTQYGKCRSGHSQNYAVRLQNPGPGYTFLFSEMPFPQLDLNPVADSLAVENMQPDTHQVLQYLVPAHDSLFKKLKGKTGIFTQEELEPFLQYLHKGYNTFDFSRFYIAPKWLCPWCVVHCPLVGNGYEPCHRNACDRAPRWKVMERKGTRPVPYERVWLKEHLGYIYGEHPDTVMVHAQNIDRPLENDTAEYIYLHRPLGGDCHAHFRYEVYRDDVRKTLTWVVYNIYGGCRAGYFEDVFFKIKNPGKGYKIVYSEILVDN